MAHRDFTDSAGNDWFVFDVTPRAEERRNYDRRRDETAASASQDDVEDRRGEGRRVTVGQRPPRLTHGWLCFERAEERRRYQPIPESWMRMSDAELDQLLGAARPAPHRKASDAASRAEATAKKPR
jgi:hypothetical protein